MEDILEICCGLDVHKESLVACLLKGTLGKNNRPHREIRQFGTLAKDLLALRNWLEKEDCRHVAMESTGIYWQPVYAALETAFQGAIQLKVVNARHMKQVPGRKTDMRDAEWIATLLRAGLLQGSFVPERDIRDLRQFTRYRKALVRDITSQKNRIEKLLQASGFRLSSFLSDIFGASGLAIMQVLVAQGSISKASLDLCLKGRARRKAPEIMVSLNGTLSLPQRRLLQMQLAHLADSQENLQEVDTQIQDDFPRFERAIALLDTIPGIHITAAYAILAEIGQDMASFPTAQHICSWAGLAPGSNQSAKKRKKQGVTHGNKYLKTMLCEVAWVITGQKKQYLAGWYWRLKQRTDAKRAVVALARKLLVIIYTMLKTNEPYNEEKFLARKKVFEQRRVNRMVNELTRLGYAIKPTT